ncbi:MAG: hypothetical protein HQM08_11735 [Candidatus Riflebacteria bacterium]|nr:hypothetical protein [Candidatus Riflebacteria bacterium]
MSSSYTYSAYGLTLRLPFPCPPLTPIDFSETPDVTVTYGSVPKKLDRFEATNDNFKLGCRWQTSPGRFLLLGGLSSGRFLVEDGKEVTVELNSQASVELVVYHFLHPVLAAILRQRGLLILHGSTCVTPQGAVVIVGLSGMGKSTTIAALLDRGCPMLADDVTALHLRSNDSCVEVLPGVPQLSLLRDAAQGLGLNVEVLQSSSLRRGKAVMFFSNNLKVKPVPLRTIYLLKYFSGDTLQIVSLTGAVKFAALQDSIYGPLLPQEHPNVFSLISIITKQVKLFCIKRPEGKWTVKEIVEVILDG